MIHRLKHCTFAGRYHLKVIFIPFYEGLYKMLHQYDNKQWIVIKDIAYMQNSNAMQLEVWKQWQNI